MVLAALASAASPDSSLTGVWRNPKNSVHVDIRPCGAAMCGVVVWASEEAIEDARKGGTTQLVGTNLMRDFVQHRDGSWRGRVFVPDLAKTISGTIRLIGSDAFRARSCALGVVCRTQIWNRLS